MDGLLLNGLKNELFNYGIGVKKQLFFEEESNNLLLITVQGDCNIEDAVNSIKDEPYKYLIDQLNTNQNIIIDLYHLEGTSSDYTIYHDYDSEFIEEVTCVEALTAELISWKVNNNYEHCKYQEIKNGEFIKLF